MANIIVNLARLNDAICKSTLSLVTKSLDTLLEKYSPDLKPIEINGVVIPHSNSPRYSNGELVPDYMDNKLLNEEQIKELLNAREQKREVQQDIKTIINFIKITIHNSVIMANAVNSYNPTEEIYFLVRKNLPETIVQDEQLLRPCFNTEQEYKLFMTAAQGKLSDEDVQEYLDKTTYPEVIEIFDKYYTLNLLTNIT